MFIELTDHLRCPEPHDEAYLVLLPDRMEGRRVVSGELGCPVCGRTVAVREEGVDFGSAPAFPAGGIPDANAAHALLGLSGPGGYLALVGGAAELAAPLGSLLPGIGLVAVNPAGPVSPGAVAGVLRAERFPLKTSSLRGVVLGTGMPPAWVATASTAVLPGLRVVGCGVWPELPGFELLAAAEREGVWVARRLGSGTQGTGEGGPMVTRSSSPDSL